MSRKDGRWLRLTVVVIATGCAFPLALATQQDRPVLDEPRAVIRSAHDLSFSRGQEKRITAEGACVYCHGSHFGQQKKKEDEAEAEPEQHKGPLWNRELPVRSYGRYTSPTYDAAPAAAAVGRSRMCLSCHDGTIALGRTLLGASRAPELQRKLSGVDLELSHPMAFELADDGQLSPSLFVEPASTDDPAVQLVHDRIECTTCHTAHNPAKDEVVKKFLVRSNQNGAICLACHDPTREAPNRLAGWEVSAHAESSREVPDQEFFGPYDTVGLNACGNCHLSHGAAGSLLLVKAEETVCGLCHGGSNLSSPLPDVMGELEKAYAHPVKAEAGVHEADEETFPLTGTRHAECADCHQPHASLALAGERTPPLLPPALNGASGFDGEGPIVPARNEFQVCFKCHADGPNKPQADPNYSVYGHAAQRQAERDSADPKNLRHKFNSTISRHNVTQPSRLSEWELPSLREAILYPDGSVGRTLEVGSYIYCSDCHSSDEASRVGGRAPNGPHGSDYPHILAARYEQEYPPYRAGGSEGEGVTFTPGPTGAYALCNLCHEVESSILLDQSFTEHNSHVVDHRTACSTCHDPHGIPEPGGNLINNHRLISFDLTIVGPDSLGQLYFDSEVRECYLSCHGIEHSPLGY